MFTSGQKIFALVFIAVFAILIGYQFYKDGQKNKTLFKGTYWIIIGVITTMIAYVLFNKAMS